MRCTRKSLRSDFVECGSLLLDVWRQVLEAAAKRTRDDGLMRLVLKAQAKATATDKARAAPAGEMLHRAAQEEKAATLAARPVLSAVLVADLRDSRSRLHARSGFQLLSRCKAQNCDRTVPTRSGEAAPMTPPAQPRLTLARFPPAPPGQPRPSSARHGEVAYVRKRPSPPSQDRRRREVARPLRWPSPSSQN